MNYKKIYDQLIERAQQREEVEGYSEIHHIIPKAVGGTNKPNNLVSLTAREHFVAHWLLAREYGGVHWRAFYAMCYLKNSETRKFRYTPSSRVLAEARENRIASMKGIPKSEEHKQALRVPKSVPSWRKGKTTPKESVEKNRKNQPGRREVHQISLDGELIKKWDSISLAQKEYGTGIAHCLMGLQKTSRGFIWEYATKEPPAKRLGGKRSKKQKQNDRSKKIRIRHLPVY